MKIINISISLFLFFAVMMVYSCSPEPLTDFSKLDPAASSQIDSLLQTFADGHHAGIAVGIVNREEIVYLKSIGVGDIEKKTPITPLSTFCGASISKPFTATAIHQLVDEDKIHLDSTISSYLPEFRMADERYESITIRHILNHTAGFPYIEDYEYESPQFDDGAVERYIQSVANISLASEPGEEYHYTDMGYNILAQLISKITGQPFETVIRQRILKPLQMDHSSFYTRRSNQKSWFNPTLLKKVRMVLSW